jgi:hypothetical protein
MSYKLFKSIVLSAALVFSIGAIDSAYAEEAKKKKEEEKEVVKTGIIASQVNAGLSQSVDVSTDGSTPGDESGVIAANVSVLDRNTCVVRVINNGKKSYSVSYELIGKDLAGSKKFTRFYSSSIQPGKSVEQRASGCGGKLNLFVDIKSAKPS